ncbi:MAG: TonB family protein [Acidobacteriales bacterium]|nr:TonB family protein [Terriglobales bacterium]
MSRATAARAKNLEQNEGRLAKAAILGTGLESSRGLDALRAEVQRYELPVALTVIVERIRAVPWLSGAAVALERNGELVCLASAGTAPSVGAVIHSQEGLSGECIRARKTIYSADTKLDPRIDPDVAAQLGLRSVLIVPVLHESKLIGLVEAFSTEARAFDGGLVQKLERVAVLVADAELNPARRRPERVEPVGLAVGPAHGETAAVAEATVAAATVAAAVEAPELTRIRKRKTRSAAPVAAWKRPQVWGTAAAVIVAGSAALSVGVLRAGHSAAAATSSGSPVSTGQAASTGLTDFVPPPPIQVAEQKPPAAATHKLRLPNSDRANVGDDSADDGVVIFHNAKPEAPVKSQASAEQASDPTLMAAALQPPIESIPLPLSSSDAKITTVANASRYTGGALVMKVMPVYPTLAKTLRVTGSVLLESHVDEQGNVTSVKVLNGSPVLRAAAINAVKQWKYQPLKLNGKPVPRVLQTEIRFKPETK